MVYTVVKIFGVDAIKTSIYKNKSDAIANIMKWIRLIAPEDFEIKTFERETGEIVYPVIQSSDPTEYTVFILKPCKIE